jgi:hypothetical protein
MPRSPFQPRLTPRVWAKLVYEGVLSQDPVAVH